MLCVYRYIDYDLAKLNRFKQEYFFYVCSAKKKKWWHVSLSENNEKVILKTYSVISNLYILLCFLLDDIFL